LKSKIFEFWGILLILASSFIQIFLLSPSQDLTNEAVIWKIEEKLDLIFMAATLNYHKLHPEENHSWNNPDQLDTYKYVEMNKDLQTTKKQTTTLQWVVGSIFLIGSLLLLIGKFMEIKETSNQSLQRTPQTARVR